MVTLLGPQTVGPRETPAAKHTNLELPLDADEFGKSASNREGETAKVDLGVESGS
jgi:hypothetical protein